jgi:hypothetical protein
MLSAGNSKTSTEMVAVTQMRMSRLLQAAELPPSRSTMAPSGQNRLARYAVRRMSILACGQLFERGFHGMVPAYMCGPLQDFTYYSCGCGVFNPACATDPSKCFGGANYEAPYIIPFDTTIVTQAAQVSSSSATTRQNPGTRNLRRGVHSELLDVIEGDDPSSSTASISAQNFHFETRETSEEVVSS